MQQRSTLFLFLVGALALGQIPRLSPAPAETPAPAQQAPAVTTAATDANIANVADVGKIPEEHDWKEPLRLYREFFGIPAPAPDSGNEWTEVRGKTGTRYRMSFLVALVPDPIDSSLAAMFDQSLSAIQQAYAESGFLLDRHWLPWLDEAARGQRYRRVPGVLLFRRSGSLPGFEGELETVLLVGESSKFGLHKQAFRNALGLIAELAPGSPIRIAGPSFSGSAESLRLALADRPARSSVRIVTGSATAPGLEEVFRLPGIEFSRTVVADDVLLEQALGFLVEELGWPDEKVALLTESDTLYGRQDQPSADGSAGPRDPMRFTQVRFPSGLAALRTEQEEAERQQGDAPQAIRLPLTALELSLAERAHPVDIVRELSPLSTHSKNLAISSLLANLRHSGIHHVGLLATDVRDKLYLTRRVQELSRNVAFFSLNNDLLLAHPQHREHMNGMLVLSSYPLSIESGDDYRRQFTSESEQGLFGAVQALLLPLPDARAAGIWISAVGNGSLWPIAHLPVTSDRSLETAPPDAAGFSLRLIDFRLVLLLGLLLLLAFWLGKAAPPWELIRDDLPSRRLLGLGLAALWLIGGALLAVATLAADDKAGGQLPWFLTGAGVFVLVTSLAARPAGRPRPRAAVLIALLAAGLLVFAGLLWALRWLWVPGGDLEGLGDLARHFFHLRARRLSSGLSPLVSLLFLGGAFYAWALLELKRRKLIARQAIGWPLCGPCEPALAGCDEIAEPLEKLLHGTLPRRGSRFWWILAALLVPPGWHLLAAVQPVAERQEYGRLFVVAALLALALCGVSFYQFIRLWLTLEKMLRRLAYSRLIGTLRGLAGEIDWKPMKSFGWQVPSLRLMMLSADKLGALERSQKFKAQPRSKEVTAQLGSVFAAQDLAAEIAARRALNRIFADASKGLSSGSEHPEVREFLAVRLAAYLRPAITHLRNCLVATMASGLLLLVTVQTYAFQPKRFLSVGIWGALLLAVVVTLWAFLQMDRNSVLSAIGGTEPGKVTFDRAFFLNVFTFGAVPLLAVIAAQFPNLGRELLGFVNPVLRVVGGG